MAKKNETKKISITQLENMVNDTYEEYGAVVVNGIEVIVKKTLSFAEVKGFIDTVAKYSFNVETGEYLPEVRDAATKVCIVTLYTNIRMPQDLSKAYELIEKSDIINSVMDVINYNQYKSILYAIREKIDYIKSNNITAFENTVNKVLDIFEDTGNKMGEIFGGMSEEEIQNVSDVINKYKFDEEKIVNAFVNKDVKE